jgi:hypothetical protein
MKVQDTLLFDTLAFISLTCINPSGHPGSSVPEVDNARLASVVSKSLSIPSSNRPTVKPSNMICENTNGKVLFHFMS